MSNKPTRIGCVGVALMIFGTMLLGGCTHADPTALEAFATDLLRSVASALLL